MNQIDQTTAPATATALPAVTTGPLPASSKRHVAGVIHPDIRVPTRQIAVHPSAGEPPVTVYDASGPYTDPAVRTDFVKGLASVRSAWMGAVRGTLLASGQGRPLESSDDQALPLPLLQNLV